MEAGALLGSFVFPFAGWATREIRSRPTHARDDGEHNRAFLGRGSVAPWLTMGA